MEHLFKTEDGFLKFTPTGMEISNDGKTWAKATLVQGNCLKGRNAGAEKPIIVHISMLRKFVTKDENDKDVFAGDRVRRINEEICFVEWFADECRYILHNNQNYYDMDVFELEQGIELIEDKKDETT